VKKIHSDTERSLVLSSSNMGSIRRCGCCNSYHLSLGNLTLRLDHTDILTLTEMLIEVLELNAMCDLNDKECRKGSA
jgi:hypothetical protein